MSNEKTEPEVQDPEAMGRAGMYGLLTRCFARELDLPTIQSLNREPLRTLLETTGCILPECDAGDSVENLAIDFCQIFLGPSGHLPPYQSVWLQGTFQGELVDSMNSFRNLLRGQVLVSENNDHDSDSISELGASHPDHPPANLAADHAAVQLDLMRRFYEAIADCHEMERGEFASLPAEYFDSHLRWIIDYAAAACQRAETDFYRSFLKLAAAFLSTEEEGR